MNIFSLRKMQNTSQNLVQFIFAGRLTHEKGADRLLNLCEYIQNSDDLSSSCMIHIYGEGPYKKGLEGYSFVMLYGFQPQDVLFEKRGTVDYCLMPSRFLETFGLSALESLSFGVPVVAEKKGGLLQFGAGIIEVDCEGSFEKTVSILIRQRKNQPQTNRDHLSKTCLSISETFSEEKRLHQVEILAQSSLGNNEGLFKKKVLLVSDYTGRIGGIETYVHDVYKRCKKSLGCSTVSLFGRDISIGSLLRYFSLSISSFNILAYMRIKSLYKENKYDFVWRHSIQRRLGPRPLLALSPKTPQWIMYHDFGLLHPFPFQVTDESQLVESSTFLGYLREGLRGRSFIMKFFLLLPLCLKYLSSFLILSLLARRIDIHLVPSAYMVPHIQRLYNQSVRVEVLPHCRNERI